MTRTREIFRFLRQYESLSDVLADHQLASLGDAFVNFAYSLALSNRRGQPSGLKVKGRLLAHALKNAELKGYLPSRVDSHTLADAAEALIVYAWLQQRVTLLEMVAILEKESEVDQAFCQLLLTIKARIKF